MMTRPFVAAAVVFALSSCRSTPEPLRVAVTFANAWRVGGDELAPEERSRLARATLDAMRAAFSGFDVVIAEAPSGARLIRVENTPPVRMPFFGAAGVTYPAARTSSVRFDVLANLELAVVHCSSGTRPGSGSRWTRDATIATTATRRRHTRISSGRSTGRTGRCRS